MSSYATMMIPADDAPLIVGELPADLPTPLRVGRWSDVLARLGDGPWPAAALAACCALTHRAPRVVLARPDVATTLSSPLTLELTPLPRDSERRPRVVRAYGADLPPPPAALASGADAGLLVVAGHGRFIPPGRGRAVPIDAASLAFTLLAAPGASLLPTVTLDALTPRERDALQPDVATLRLARGRVALPPGISPLAPGPTAERPPADPLAAALEALVKTHAFRLERGDAGALAGLRREAERILREEVRARRVEGFAIAVAPGEDDDGPVALEVVLRLPRRVRQVVLRVGQVPGDGDVRVRKVELEEP